MLQCDICRQSYHGDCASTFNDGNCACVCLALDHEWDSSLSIRIGELTSDVPEQVWCPAGPRSTASMVTMEAFFEAYPGLCAENSGAEMSVQDGHSCQFIAVGLTACGSPLIAQKLRILAVRELCRQWDTLGDVARSEIAAQSGEDLESLDQARCCKLMLGSSTRMPLWGNEVTLVVLPSIVKKNIALLTISNGRPFKRVYRCDDCNDTVYVGFIPECHFFAVTVASAPSESIKSCDRSNDEDISMKSDLQQLTKTKNFPVLTSQPVVQKRARQCSFGEFCQFLKEPDTDKSQTFQHCPVCDSFFHDSCVPYSDIGCPCIFANDVRNPKGVSIHQFLDFKFNYITFCSRRDQSLQRSHFQREWGGGVQSKFWTTPKARTR